MICRDVGWAVSRELSQEVQIVLAGLIKERGAIPNPINPTALNFQRLNDAINTIQNDRAERLNGIHLLNLEDFPDRLIGFYDDVPSADRAVVARTRAKAEQFFPGMRQIRKTFTLNDPEPWIEEIEASRKP